MKVIVELTIIGGLHNYLDTAKRAYSKTLCLIAS